jgi:hypothetical protein
LKGRTAAGYLQEVYNLHKTRTKTSQKTDDNIIKRNMEVEVKQKGVQLCKQNYYKSNNGKLNTTYF